MIKKLLCLLVLLLTATTGAWAQTTINVTAGDLGKAVCTDGSIYDDVNAAKSAGKTAAAKIICLDTQNSKALALSLDDQAVEPSPVNYATAQSKCEALNTTLAVTFGTWVLPSKAQWEAMIVAAGGYNALRDDIGPFFGGTMMQAVTYWSSTAGTTGHWRINFYDGKWDDNTGESSARACLVINLPQTYSVTLADGTEDADKWTVKVGEGEAQTFPVKGLLGGETVTATYSGTRKVKSVKAVDPMLATPMTIEAITAGSINVANPKEGMQYSKNGGAKTAVTTSIDVATGDKVQFYGKGTSITKYGDPEMSKCTQITGSGEGFTCKVYGNIMSLVDEENFATAKTLSDIYTFKFLFYNNTTLTDASRLLLPATQLQESCYMQMFMNCTALTAAPALPAETLAYGCYQQMFASCTALTAAPVLPAKKLVYYCYESMFNYCQKLATVTCLATSGINKDSSTYNWIWSAGSEVQGTKTVYTVSTANWPSDANGIPSGWTRVNIDN